MNLSKLFEIQAGLDKRIVEEHGLEGQDLLDKKILALQVELGECANEWRGFKFWSKDQKPRAKEIGECLLCNGTGDLGVIYAEQCIDCNGSGKRIIKNPLLEEYVDCLHFILSIGLDLEFRNYPLIGFAPETRTVKDMFLVTFESLNNFYKSWILGNEEMTEIKYTIVFDTFLTLGSMLEFSGEQIEQAYMNKNKVNHERQNNEY